MNKILTEMQHMMKNSKYRVISKLGILNSKIIYYINKKLQIFNEVAFITVAYRIGKL